MRWIQLSKRPAGYISEELRACVVWEAKRVEDARRDYTEDSGRGFCGVGVWCISVGSDFSGSGAVCQGLFRSGGGLVSVELRSDADLGIGCEEEGVSFRRGIKAGCVQIDKAIVAGVDESRDKEDSLTLRRTRVLPKTQTSISCPIFATLTWESSVDSTWEAWISLRYH